MILLIEMHPRPRFNPRSINLYRKKTSTIESHPKKYFVSPDIISFASSQCITWKFLRHFLSPAIIYKYFPHYFSKKLLIWLMASPIIMTALISLWLLVCACKKFKQKLCRLLILIDCPFASTITIEVRGVQDRQTNSFSRKGAAHQKNRGAEKKVLFCPTHTPAIFFHTTPIS